MRRAEIGGDIVPWRDVLHEGPVPALAPAELRPVRARYLARLGFPEAGQLEAELCARDERLGAALEAGEPVVLWFEHDLYDQLQLLQILAGLPDGPSAVELICIGAFPGRPGFAGLGELEPGELASLWPVRAPVTPAHVPPGGAPWGAFPGTARPGPPRARPRRARRLGRLPWHGPARARPRRGRPRRAPAVPCARAAAAARG